MEEPVSKPLSETTRQQSIRAVGYEREADVERSEAQDLMCDRARRRISELREESQEEYGDLRVEHADDDSIREELT